MEGFIVSDTTPSEKKELLTSISFLFEELNKYDAKPKKEYLIPLFKEISNKEYEDAILLSRILFNFIKNQKNLQKQVKIHKKQLELKKGQIAELQSVKGYCQYKTKNILMRLKNKV